MKTILNLLLGACLAMAAYAQPSSIHDVFTFPCNTSGPGANCPEGAKPDGIIQASDGNFYGVSEGPLVYGGNGGTIFKITASGQLTVLHTFTANHTTGFYDNGQAPVTIVEGSDGLLYGAASIGGTTSASSGTLWKIHKDGTGFQVLQRYCTSCTTGSFPNYIMSASDGNLYGTTGYGGSFTATVCQGLGCGVVFRLTTGGAYTVLHTFNGTTDSYLPDGITQASDGNFYGATSNEGTGAIFRVTSSGAFTILHTFPTSTYSLAPLTQASNGLLYGFSHLVSAGTIEFFSCSLTGSFQNINQITQPLFKQFGVGKLLQATDGNLWTSTAYGGASNFGRVFSITPSGTILDSISFSGTNGGFATGGLIQATEGTLWGTTTQRGTVSSGVAEGVVFTVSGLPPK
jgi:uncharacterized repeat protein (TIGR03803 family)